MSAIISLVDYFVFNIIFYCFYTLVIKFKRSKTSVEGYGVYTNKKKNSPSLKELRGLITIQMNWKITIKE